MASRALCAHWPSQQFSLTSSLGLVLVARATGHWQTNIPRAVYVSLVPHMNQVSHPGI